MSHRPITAKKVRRMRRALNRRPLQASINLLEYLVDRRLARSRREAREMILAKRVVVDSHPLGIGRAPVAAKNDKGEIEVEIKDVVHPVVPADLRSKITILPASLTTGAMHNNEAA